MPTLRINPPLDEVFCPGCGSVTCYCEQKARHRGDCRYLRAARLSFELACDHGYQACPECDPCSCGAGGEVALR